jgi:hypothetical protein
MAALLLIWMWVGDLDFVGLSRDRQRIEALGDRLARSPFEAEAPFSIDSDAVLPLSISAHSLKLVRWWIAKVNQPLCRLQLCEGLLGSPLTLLKRPHSLARRQSFRAFVTVTADRHAVGLLINTPYVASLYVT